MVPAEARQGRRGDASVTPGLTGKKRTWLYGTEIEAHGAAGKAFYDRFANSLRASEIEKLMEVWI